VYVVYKASCGQITRLEARMERGSTMTFPVPRRVEKLARLLTLVHVVLDYQVRELDL